MIKLNYNLGMEDVIINIIALIIVGVPIGLLLWLCICIIKKAVSVPNFPLTTAYPVINEITIEHLQKHLEEDSEIIEKDKSVIERAIIGGILFGSVGAIVGGMSGLGTKKEIITTLEADEKIYLKVISKSLHKTTLLFLVNKYNNTEAYTLYNRFLTYKRNLRTFNIIK